jgi:hypothetical protein
LSLALALVSYAVLSFSEVSDRVFLSLAVLFSILIAGAYSPKNNIVLGLKNIYLFDWAVAIGFSVILALVSQKNNYQLGAAFICFLVFSLACTIRVRAGRK